VGRAEPGGGDQLVLERIDERGAVAPLQPRDPEPARGVLIDRTPPSGVRQQPARLDAEPDAARAVEHGGERLRAYGGGEAGVAGLAVEPVQQLVDVAAVEDRERVGRGVERAEDRLVVRLRVHGDT
jgi:hypothetical protein